MPRRAVERLLIVDSIVGTGDIGLAQCVWTTLFLEYFLSMLWMMMDTLVLFFFQSTCLLVVLDANIIIVVI